MIPHITQLTHLVCNKHLLISNTKARTLLSIIRDDAIEEQTVLAYLNTWPYQLYHVITLLSQCIWLHHNFSKKQVRLFGRLGQTDSHTRYTYYRTSQQGQVMRFPPPPTCMEGMYTAGRGGQAVCYDRGESGRHQAPTISTRVNYGPPLSLLPTE